MSDVSFCGEGSVGREHEYKHPGTKGSLACLRDRKAAQLDKELVESLL